MNPVEPCGSRRDFYTIIVGTWLLVTIYAILHDQYLVRISPEHFTVYHDPLWGIKNPPLLAAAYAFCAATVPSIMLGCAAAIFSLALPEKSPPWRPKQVLLGVICVIIIAELTSAASGLYAWQTGNMLYGNNWYPDKSLSLIITQTIQLTCYLSSTFYSCVFFGIVIYKRMRR